MAKKRDAGKHDSDVQKAKHGSQKSKIVSSTKRDGDQALEYWSVEEMERAKPRAMQKREPKKEENG